jgi:hypothetical protein
VLGAPPLLIIFVPRAGPTAESNPIARIVRASARVRISFRVARALRMTVQIVANSSVSF